MSAPLLLVLVPVLCSAAPTPAPSSDPQADLVKGRALVRAFKYADAVKVLTRVRASKGLDRPTLLEVLQLLGISHGQVRATDRAEQAFRELLTLDPKVKLGADYAPRVMTPFFAAQQAVADEGALAASAGPPVTSADSVDYVGLSVEKDPLHQVRSARFHVLGRAEAEDVPVTDGLARVAVSGAEVRWWAELLGANAEQLLLLGTEAAPLVVRIAAPAPSAPPPPLQAEVRQAPAPGFRWSGSRVGAVVSLGVGVASAGVGVAFGLMSSATFQRITSATRTADGVVTGLTEAQASSLRAQGRTQATVANVLFGVGGAAAVAAVVLWLVPGAPPVALLPTPGGLAFTTSLAF